MHENQEAKVLFPKHQQSVNDDILKRYGVFGRQIEVKNVFKGIETIASTFGFSGIEPNTILMGWAKNTNDPIWFAQMTQKLIDLDYNVLYLDYDERFGFRKYAQIDLWWRGVGNNAELMLNISKFLVSSKLWRNAQIRVLLVDNTNSNKKVIEKKINNLLDNYRVAASIKIIGNALEERSIYELMKSYSFETDLVLVGIPAVNLDEAKNFVINTNDLVKTIGTTLLVKASSRFDEMDFFFHEEIIQQTSTNGSKFNTGLPALLFINSSALSSEIINIDEGFHAATADFIENIIAPIQEKYIDFYQLILAELKIPINSSRSEKDSHLQFLSFLNTIQQKLQQIRTEDLPILSELFTEENKAYLDAVNTILNKLPSRLKLQVNGKNTSIKFRQTAQLLKDRTLFTSIRNTYINFGNQCYENLFKTKNELVAKIYSLFELDDFHQNNPELETHILAVTTELSQIISNQLTFFQDLSKQFSFELQSAGRIYCNDLTTVSQASDFKKQFNELKQKQNKKRKQNKLGRSLVFPFQLEQQSRGYSYYNRD